MAAQLRNGGTLDFNGQSEVKNTERGESNKTTVLLSMTTAFERGTPVFQALSKSDHETTQQASE